MKKKMYSHNVIIKNTINITLGIKNSKVVIISLLHKMVFICRNAFLKPNADIVIGFFQQHQSPNRAGVEAVGSPFAGAAPQ
jgi:hypothetical protein